MNDDASQREIASLKDSILQAKTMLGNLLTENQRLATEIAHLRLKLTDTEHPANEGSQ